jgi:hypothetical protein
MHHLGPIIPRGSLAEAFRRVPDPRRPYGWRPDYPPLPLVSLLLLIVAALLCGAKSLSAIAQWGRERQADRPDLLLALGFPPGHSPALVTLHRLVRRLDVNAFEQALALWLTQTGVSPDEPIALDGQTLRAVAASAVPGSHVVSVYTQQAQAVLAQIIVPNKGHEQPAVDHLLTQIPLKGRLVTFDALRTHRDVCLLIEEAGGAVLAPVKANQATLLVELHQIFSPLAAARGTPISGSGGSDSSRWRVGG